MNLMEHRHLYRQAGLTREELARTAMTNRTYVTLAMESMHTTFSEFVNSYRVRNAVDLLLRYDNSRLSISEVAEMCGFSSMETMSRWMKKNIGMSPTMLKKRKLLREHFIRKLKI